MTQALWIRMRCVDHAPIQTKQMYVGDGISAEYPVALTELFVGGGPNFGDVLLAHPACRMQGRGDERHPRYRLALGERIVRQQAGSGKALGQIEQAARDLGPCRAV